MRLFGPLYERALRWSQHRHAPRLLAVLSFFEAIIFPVMPEVMLAPMALTQPRRALWFATLSLIGSLLGALIGYALGHFAYVALQPVIDWLGWRPAIESQVQELKQIVSESPWKAFWLLVLAGFTPIPLKIFTWASGIVGVPLIPFLASMVIGRGKRVYLLAIAIKIGGVRAEAALRRWIEPVGWMATGLLLMVVGWLVWRAKYG
ncbi:MAG: DedA family protein [Xanthomonadaceae bacterium]|jgi:membrane protein YqaA with SNARE-associated domain|nr:DedA family protein [Xanthomonadaceae bacterium]